MDKWRESLERLFVSILYDMEDIESLKDKVRKQFEIEDNWLNVYEIINKLGYSIFKADTDSKYECELIINYSMYIEYGSDKIIRIKPSEEENNRYAMWFVLTKAWLVKSDILSGKNIYIRMDTESNLSRDVMASIVARKLCNA